MALFQKKMDPRCSYCTHSRPLEGDQVICEKTVSYTPLDVYKRQAKNTLRSSASPR